MFVFGPCEFVFGVWERSACEFVFGVDVWDRNACEFVFGVWERNACEFDFGVCVLERKACEFDRGVVLRVLPPKCDREVDAWDRLPLYDRVPE